MKFADIKVGDVVAQHVGAFRRLRKTRVTRVTETRFSVEDGMRYRKRDGGNVGGGIYGGSVDWWTEKHDQEIADVHALAAISARWTSLRQRLDGRTILASLTLDDLNAMHAIIDAAEARRPE